MTGEEEGVLLADGAADTEEVLLMLMLALSLLCCAAQLCFLRTKPPWSQASIPVPA